MLRVSPTTRPRCSSIVMAILLCRRICRATRGWMSRAVRNDPHDLRVRAQLKLLSHVQLRVVEADLLPGEPEQLALEDLCPADAAVELREGGQLVRRAVPCGKRQAGLDPAFTGMLTVGVLPLLQSLSAATQGQGRGSGASDPSVLARPSQELAPTRWTCWPTRNPAFTRAPDGCLIHRTLTESRNQSSKHVVGEALTGRYNLASRDLRKVREQ